MNNFILKKVKDESGLAILLDDGLPLDNHIESIHRMLFIVRFPRKYSLYEDQDSGSLFLQDVWTPIGNAVPQYL